MRNIEVLEHGKVLPNSKMHTKRCAWLSSQVSALLAHKEYYKTHNTVNFTFRAVYNRMCFYLVYIFCMFYIMDMHVIDERGLGCFEPCTNSTIGKWNTKSTEGRKRALPSTSLCAIKQMLFMTC